MHNSPFVRATNVTCLAVAALCSGLSSQSPAGVRRLFQGNNKQQVQLVDSTGATVHTWQTQFFASPSGGNVVHLDNDGALIRAIVDGSGTTGLQRLAFDGTLLWDHRLPRSHHDFELLPNGNVLRIVFDIKTQAEAIAHGRDPSLLRPGQFTLDSILEIQPTGPTSGTVVWEWHLWDHLIQDFDPTKANYGVVANHPELLDINHPRTLPPTTGPSNEFSHCNGVDYDPANDWIAITSRFQGEVWIIDHGTTTAEAASHSGGRRGKGGDLLYRWGNPAAYRAGTTNDQMLYAPHAPWFVPEGYSGAGNLMVFNNLFMPNQSAVFELVLPVSSSGQFTLGPSGRYGPAGPAWSYTDPNLFSSLMSSVQRLPNGNTLICSAQQGWIFEVTPAGQRIWEHQGSGHIWLAEPIQRTLWANKKEVPATSGGRLDFDLLGGSPAANDLYLLLCSGSGTSPGTPIFGTTLPLNYDPFFLVSSLYPNSPPIFVNTLGTLGPLGDAAAAFTLPAGVAPGGFRLDFAYLRIGLSPLSFEAGSNAVPLTAR